MTGGTRPTIEGVQQEIIREMSSLDGLGKYEYLVAWGRELRCPDGLRIEEYAVPGCQSRVWIRAEMRDGRLRLFADSDALITRGIIALLLRVLDGHPPADIVGAELHFLEATGLGTHLSPSRANGLATMVKRIRACAAEWR